MTDWLGPDGAGDRERTVVCDEEALHAGVTAKERKMAKGGSWGLQGRNTVDWRTTL